MADSLDLPALIAGGWRFAPDAHGWNATDPNGQHAHGSDIAEAIRNIGSQIHVRPDGVRVLHRVDGSEYILDAWARPVEPIAEPAAEEPPADPIVEGDANPIDAAPESPAVPDAEVA